MSYPFYILDVFAPHKYAGNQLAVIRHSAKLTSAEMLAIAKEMNYSETTFIYSDSPREGGYDVRIFTPGEEVPFAGHPTLGTAYVIQQTILQHEVAELVLNLAIGKIPVTFTYDAGLPHTLWMRQVQPAFLSTLDPQGMADLLGLTLEDIDSRFPIQEVSTGLPFIIVPLKNLAAVKKCRPETRRLLDYVAALTAKNILVFAPETYNRENDYNARVFTDYLGIPEDPATGSANGCLAAYLVKHRYNGTTSLTARVEQGYEIGRPSLLLLKAEEQKGSIAVHVGGQVVLVAHGTLL